MLIEVVARNRIRPLREERGLSLRELAERAQLPIATVTASELPQRSPRYDTARRLAAALDVDVSEIYA